MKDVAPTTELRQWFSHEVQRWDEFRRRYRKELNANPSGREPILETARHGMVTLLHSAHDTLHNGAVVLRDDLAERPAERRRGAKHVGQRLTLTATETKTSSETGRTHGSAQQRAR